MQRIGVIGAGAWGTALAQVLAAAGREVTLWAREDSVAAGIEAERENKVFLPGIALSDRLNASTDMAAVATAELVLLVAPAQYLGKVAAALAEHLTPAVPLVICAKGMERGSLKLMTEVVAEAAPRHPLAVLSGPTFAIEVARGLPTAVTLAIEDTDLGETIAQAIGQPHFRPYLSDDLVGAQIGGAIKNVIAIACGIVEGRGLGDNARAALMTRGLAEMLRFGRTKGAKPETLMGLSGLGDLSLTCNGRQSRNMSLGMALGEGRGIQEIMGKRHSVAEGVATAAAITQAAEVLAIELPIARAVDRICNMAGDIEAEIGALLARPFTREDA
ncbi:MAG: NAD(P)H-dependent glycerol-3-phosphate dehydrogenase [Alphaproteobacteria bacterium]|jgi:glycerol-3-phosphate dehydrogenase (NAD(P)+)|nr:NAD(P)H-dependent glycerol-3-phosphate dehydrogenase [Alphaproteobacteria bacterium]